MSPAGASLLTSGRRRRRASFGPVFLSGASPQDLGAVQLRPRTMAPLHWLVPVVTRCCWGPLHTFPGRKACRSVLSSCPPCAVNARRWGPRHTLHLSPTWREGGVQGSASGSRCFYCFQTGGHLNILQRKGGVTRLRGRCLPDGAGTR